MRTWRIQSKTRDVFLRVVADILMISAALWMALAGRYLWLVGIQGDVTAQKTFDLYVYAFATSVGLVSLISLVIFSLSGFYTRGRAYRGRYKLLAIIQAVSLGYVVFGFAEYFFHGFLKFPRAALPFAWILTLCLVVAARFLSKIWSEVLQRESRDLASSAHRTIERVLVIGGVGYIGSALVPKLLAAGYQVRVLDLLLYGIEPLEPVLRHPQLEVVQADFRQIDKVVEAMRDVDAVIHLGAIVGDPACALDEDLTIDVNLMATRMIGEVAKGHRVNRFIFASTCSVYGASDEILDECSVLNPVSLYARSKIACEQILGTLADDSFAPVFLRFGTIFGLSGRTRFDLVVNLLTAKSVIEGKITVAGPDQWRPFLHVDDAALAILKALQAPLSVVRNEVFNVGSDEQNYTIGQVGELIRDMVPSSQLVQLATDGDRRNYRVDFGKIRKTLHFQPQWTLEKGIGQVIDAIASGRVLDYRDARYSNVKFLSEEGRQFLPLRQNNWAQELLNGTSRKVPTRDASLASA